MAKEEHVRILNSGIEYWNLWRNNNKVFPDLSGISIIRANLIKANLSGTDLTKANLSGADLSGANLSGADLSEVNLSGAHLNKANFHKAYLSGAQLQGAKLTEANLSGTSLTEAILSRAELSGADLSEADLSRADLSGAFLRGANLYDTNLSDSNLTGAILVEANLTAANLSRANLNNANLGRAILSGANFLQANLLGANLTGVNLMGANLEEANLMYANLMGAICIETNFSNAIIESTYIYGISTWNIQISGLKQKNLIITKPNEPTITVDNIEVAQFIYLILNNEKIRDVIGTIAKKGVLILGRFTPERKIVLDAIRDKLRECDFVPIMFDFEKVSSRDFTETIKILAGMSRFVIADITNPSSAPLELQAAVPDYKIPFLPIIQKGEHPFAMFIDLQQKYNWVLELLEYNSETELMEGFQKGILDRAMEADKRLYDEKQAPNPKTLDMNDFKD